MKGEIITLEGDVVRRHGANFRFSKQQKLHSSHVDLNDYDAVRDWMYVAILDLHVLHGWDVKAAWEQAYALLGRPRVYPLSQKAYQCRSVRKNCGFLERSVRAQQQAHKHRVEDLEREVG